jgi:cyclase
VSPPRIRIAAGTLGAMLVAALAIAPAASAAGDPVELAPGIFQFVTPDVAGNVVGNSIAVVMESDVLMFDTTLLPGTAASEIRELSKLTQKPVRYIVNSHWHPDHSGGNAGFTAAYPDLEIISSRETRRLMQNTANVYVKTLEFENRELTSSLGAGGTRLSAKDREDLRAQIAAEDRFLEEFKAAQTKLPTLTFDKTMTLYHGGREMRFLALPGHTAGDVALYLPAEKILFSGDLLAYPVPFCADSHPTEWITSLETLSRLDASTIVPGHGPAQHDKLYLTLVLESLRSIQQQVQDALQRGLTFQETQKAVKLDAIRSSFTHGDPETGASFDGNFTPVVRQMYDEATEGLEQYQ